MSDTVTVGKVTITLIGTGEHLPSVSKSHGEELVQYVWQIRKWSKNSKGGFSRVQYTTLNYSTVQYSLTAYRTVGTAPKWVIETTAAAALLAGGAVTSKPDKR